MSPKAHKVSAVESPRTYFQKLVHEAILHQEVEASEETEFYLVNLLHEFIDASNLFQKNPEGFKEEPLALMLARALRSNRERKIQILKHLGDTTLYMAGFFPESVDRKIIDLGYYISMSGIVSFPKATNVHEVCRKIPDYRLLIETDSPWLGPVPFRGKPNEPAFVSYVAEAVAQIRGTEPQVIADQTTENFFRLFGAAYP